MPKENLMNQYGFRIIGLITISKSEFVHFWKKNMIFNNIFAVLKSNLCVNSLSMILKIKLLLFNNSEIAMKEISIVPTSTIRNHQTNNSTSKTVYQFSKSPRFPGPNPQCKVAFYCNSSQLSNRKAGFGYGQKSDFTKNQTVSPASTKYFQNASLQKNKAKGFTIGKGRQKFPDKSYLIPQMHKNPGPGQYQNQFRTRMNQSFTMRPQTIDVLQSRKTYKQSPGPGNYQQINLQPKNGRFSVSKYSDAKFSLINKNNPRFMTIKDSPGPLSYREGGSINGQAKYTLSNHKSHGTRAFSRTKRLTFINQSSNKSKQLPSPGSYELPTQFGVYGDAKYFKS